MPADSSAGHDPAPSIIPMAYVRRAHGIRGDVVVRGLVSDAGERLAVGTPVVTASGDRWQIQSVQSHSGDLIVHLEGIDDRNAAESLVGEQFVMSKDDRRELDADEWWIEDLVGCRIEDPDGIVLGTVSDVVVGEAQDRLVIGEGSSRFEIPFVDPLVPEVDVPGGRLIVDLPEGLVP